MFGLVLGLPLYLLLRKRGPGSLRAYALAGVAIASTPIAIFLVIVAGRGKLTAYIAGYNLALFGLGGLLAGVLFWLIARPDRRSRIGGA